MGEMVSKHTKIDCHRLEVRLMAGMIGVGQGVRRCLHKEVKSSNTRVSSQLASARTESDCRSRSEDVAWVLQFAALFVLTLFYECLSTWQWKSASSSRTCRHAYRE